MIDKDKNQPKPQTLDINSMAARETHQVAKKKKPASPQAAASSAPISASGLDDCWLLWK